MKVIRLQAENVKKLRAVSITPVEGEPVVIAGKNGAGKSSVLDSIAYAFGGREAICDQPVRDGEERAIVIVETEEFTVTRTFTADGGGKLTVSTKEGANFPAPQKKLDEVRGALSFDPLEFQRMDNKRRSEVFRKLVNVDFTELNAQRGALFLERADLNREVVRLRSLLEAKPDYVEAPVEEVSTAALLAELEAAQARNAERAADRDRVAGFVKQAQDDVDALRIKVANAQTGAESLVAEIARLTEQLARQNDAIELGLDSIAKAEARAADLQSSAPGALAAVVDEDIEARRQAIKSADETNALVRRNHERRILEESLGETRGKAQTLTAALEAIELTKRDMIRSANLPVEGLGLDDDGDVTVNDLPFSQASRAEQIRVSVAMGMALNPKLRVMCIHDGSLLDDDSLAKVTGMAKTEDYQLWIERIAEGGASIVIEEGEVRADARA